MRRTKKIGHVIAVDMGYGHLRAAYNLSDISKGEVASVNTYRGIPEKDKIIWDQSRQFYEFVSRFKKVPFFGEKVFGWFDKFQAIEPYYPYRDLSKPSIQLSQTLKLIRKRKWGDGFVKKFNKDKIPLVNTFFVSAYMAEEHGFENDIYLNVCDADISRAWAMDKASISKIKYFVPTERAQSRLKMYGVPAENIYYTGFPLPKENTGSKRLTIAKKDLGLRLPNLDPEKRYIKRYRRTIEKYIDGHLKAKSDHILTIMFAVGGAGAQRETGIKIVKALQREIIEQKIKIILVAGIHNDVSKYFRQEVCNLGLRGQINKGVEIIFAEGKPKYFQAFNKALHQTDILWTKPSELSFYVGLGIPIIMTEPLGSQELCNRGWLERINAGIRQKEIAYTSEWLFEWLNKGILAEAAMEGFIGAPNLGTYKIEEVVNKNFKTPKISK